MSDYTPSMEQIRSHYVFDQSDRWDPERGEAFDRALAAHDAEVRASVLVEQGEPEGRRWYAACWRDDNGTLNALESDTILREYAEADVKRWRDAERREEGGRPDLVVLGTKLQFPWLPVEENGETMTACCTTSEPCEKHQDARHQELPESTDGSER